MSVPVLRALGAVLSFAAAVAGQIPDGRVVVARAEGTNAFGGPGGITLVHPRSGSSVDLTGIPPGLLSPGTNTQRLNGPRAVAVRDDDGLLAIGEITDAAGRPVRIHLLTLAGTQVTAVRSVTIGTATTAQPGALQVSSVPQLGFLPDGDLLFVAQGVTNYVTTPLGRVDVAAGAASPIALGLTPPGQANGMSLSRDGRTVYVGMVDRVGSTDTTRVYATSIAGGAVSTLATFNGLLTALATENDGRVLASVLDGSRDLKRIDPTTSSFTTLVTGIPAVGNSFVQGLAVERATGEVFATLRTAFINQTAHELYRIAPNGQSARLAGVAQGVPLGIAAVPDPRPFGRATSRAGQSYRFAYDPTPGGLPRVGNAAFRIRIAAQGTLPSTAALALSFGRLATPVDIGFWLNLDPTRALAAFALAPGATMELPLAIPQDPTLVGVVLNAQAICVRNAAVAATGGLAVTILD